MNPSGVDQPLDLNETMAYRQIISDFAFVLNEDMPNRPPLPQAPGVDAEGNKQEPTQTTNSISHRGVKRKYNYREKHVVYKDYEHYQIGIDAGSKTVKICLCDEDGEPIFSVYRRHQSDIRTTLKELLHELTWRYGKIKGTIAITGSAGIGVAEALGIPFVQEVVATTKIVKAEYPEADAVIELGGEDAKVIYLTGGLEQRMNATCAGGTGGFIDTIAYMLGVSTRDMDKLSTSAARIYPIASRCAVFAQTDIRPLMNAGARTNDLAASALDAVVRQTIGGLACGRPITGTVVFLGGPNHYLNDLVRRFRRALGLSNTTGIKPPFAHFFTARGAGMYGAELPEPTVVVLSDLEEKLEHLDFSDGSIQRLEPLFTNPEEVEAFKERHAKATIKRSRLDQQTGPVYLGIDAGSTTVKLALINEEGDLLYGAYEENEGDVLQTTADMLAQLYRDFPKRFKGEAYVYLAHAVATGYGEDMLKAGLGVDSGVVETTAHVQGALQFAPDASFVLDIGGQDMKAIWVKDGLVQNAVLNEACSSGCGSFISGTAHGLKLDKTAFADVALTAEAPVDLGTKCTVFMNSRLKHAQKTGASSADLAAGCAYSVVKNALFRIIGINNLDSLGNKIVVQGGTFMNDAILRAFELISGKEVIRPDRANLMGAIGAAFIARSRAHAQGENARSTLITDEELHNFKPKRTAITCEGCANGCTLSVVSFGDTRNYIGGNRCGKALTLYAKNQKDTSQSAPNAIAAERGLMRRFHDEEGEGERGTVRVGIMNVLRTYQYVPFWHTFFRTLGFSVLLPNEQEVDFMHTNTAGSDTVPSESVCYPAKCSHKRLKALSDAGATHAFMPRYARGVNCAVTSTYVDALRDGAIRTEPLAQNILSPDLDTANPYQFPHKPQTFDALTECINTLLQPLGQTVSQEELDAAYEAGIAVQRAHEDGIRKANQHVLDWIESDKNHHGVLLMGRPYHVDEDISHKVDELLSSLGLAVLSPTVISREEAPRVQLDESAYAWNKSSHMLRLANYAIQHERLEAVALQSFGCAYDSISLNDVADFMAQKGRLFTALKIDEIVDTAHIRIRLRTLAENIEQITLAQNEGVKRVSDDTMSNDEIRVFLPIEEPYLTYAREGDLKAFSQINAADVETARTHTRDLCYSTVAIVGRAIRLLAADPTLTHLTLPNICTACVLDSIPSILKRVTGRSIDITWQAGWPIDEIPAEKETSDKPLIGIIGTAPLCFDDYLNDSIVSVIEEHGCQAVLPQIDGLMVDDVRYLDQLQRFYDMGVRHVIYLMSFGCLKAHVNARGALHELSERFPGMNITVLDYDPEASALNRENRVLLMLASALEI